MYHDYHFELHQHLGNLQEIAQEELENDLTKDGVPAPIVDCIIEYIVKCNVNLLDGYDKYKLVEQIIDPHYYPEFFDDEGVLLESLLLPMGYKCS